MNALRRKIATHLALEMEYAVTRQFREVLCTEENRSLRLRYEHGNFRKSQALCITGSSDRLEVLKSHIARGEALEAKAMFEKIENDQADDPVVHADICIQGCRTAVLFGDWLSVIERASRIEHFEELPALSRLTLLQIRALAFFEARDYRNADRDLSKAELICELFPHAPAVLYVHVLRAKLIVRMESFDEARRAIDALWAKWSCKLPEKNLDSALVLLRLEIDLARKHGKLHAAHAIGSYLVSKALGDDLYTALAWVDLSNALGAHELKSNPCLERAGAKHPRIERLLREVESKEIGSDTAESMKAWKTFAHSSRVLPLVLDIERIRCVFIVNESIRIDLAEGASLLRAPLTPRSHSVLCALADGPMSKQEIFAKVWGIRTFVKERHDPAIRTALRRLRQEAGLSIDTDGDKLSLDSSVLVLCR